MSFTKTSSARSNTTRANKMPFRTQNITGAFTPLMQASANGNLVAVELFLEEGADVNARGPRESTALMFAASGGHLEIVKALVEQGAELNAREGGGWTAKRHAEEDGHYDVVNYLKLVEQKYGRVRQ